MIWHHHDHHHDAYTAVVRCDDSPRCPRSSAFCHPTGWGSLADLLYPCPPGTPRRSSPVIVPGQWPAFVATTCSSAWCAGVVASSLTTWPNSVWRRLVIMSPMFGRPVMSVFFTWSCHLIPSSWRWHHIMIWRRFGNIHIVVGTEKRDALVLRLTSRSLCRCRQNATYAKYYDAVPRHIRPQIE